MADVSVRDGEDSVTIQGSHPAVSIAWAVCIFVFLITLVFAIFATQHMAVIPYIAGVLAVMGVSLAVIATRRSTSGART